MNILVIWSWGTISSRIIISNDTSLHFHFLSAHPQGIFDDIPQLEGMSSVVLFFVLFLNSETR